MSIQFAGTATIAKGIPPPAVHVAELFKAIVQLPFLIAGITAKQTPNQAGDKIFS